MTKVINLTPHTVKVVNADNEVIREYASVGVARVATTAEVVGEVDGIDIRKTVFGALVGLPDNDSLDLDDPNKTIYIVSMVVAQAAHRSDLVAPDSGPTAYRVDGLIVGVRAFAQY